MVRVGVIGTGDVADRWLAPALREIPNAVLYSVLSRDLDRGIVFANKHGAQSAIAKHTNLENFLSDPDLNAVIIATPDALHAEQTIRAAEFGKHVFVEKPMATCSSDAFDMIASCKQSKVKLAVGYHHRFHEGHKILRDKIISGDLGKILHMRCHWTYDYSGQENWRAKNSVGRWFSLAALGTHCIDLTMWFLTLPCGDIDEFPRVLTKDNEFDRDESAIITGAFDSGTTYEIFTSVLFNSKRVVEIYGTNGVAMCEWTLGPRGAGTIKINDQEIVFDIKNPYREELADFVHAIISGSEPTVSGEVGLENVRLLGNLARK